jgi:hypothetical protein
LKLKESIQAWLNGALNDPIVKVLAKNSQLTKTQLETLLIDVKTVQRKRHKIDIHSVAVRVFRHLRKHNSRPLSRNSQQTEGICGSTPRHTRQG